MLSNDKTEIKVASVLILTPTPIPCVGGGSKFILTIKEEKRAHTFDVMSNQMVPGVKWTIL